MKEQPKLSPVKRVHVLPRPARLEPQRNLCGACRKIFGGVQKTDRASAAPFGLGVHNPLRIATWKPMNERVSRLWQQLGGRSRSTALLPFLGPLDGLRLLLPPHERLDIEPPHLIHHHAPERVEFRDPVLVG